MASFRRLRTALAHACAVLALAGLATPACAMLGGDAAGVKLEQARMRATLAVTGTAQGVSTHDLRLADGSSIREFSNAQGIVFAVSWSTRLKPDFTQLLGRYVTDFDAGAADALRQPGLKRSVQVEHGDLVLQSSGRPGAFVGKAWLKSLWPAGLAADALR